MSKSTARAAELFAQMKRNFESGGYSRAKEYFLALHKEYAKARNNNNDVSYISELIKEANIMEEKMRNDLSDELTTDE